MSVTGRKDTTTIRLHHIFSEKLLTLGNPFLSALIVVVECGNQSPVARLLGFVMGMTLRFARLTAIRLFTVTLEQP